MVVQQINAGADVATIQELLGHSKIQMTMQYSRLSNMRAKCDYYEAMEKILLGEYVKQWSIDTPH